MIARWLRRLLRIHSPSGHMLDTCWCQPKPTALDVLDTLAQQIAAHQAVIDAYLASVEARPPYRVTYETQPEEQRGGASTVSGWPPEAVGALVRARYALIEARQHMPIVIGPHHRPRTPPRHDRAHRPPK